jgi:hypothetical protein
MGLRDLLPGTGTRTVPLALADGESELLRVVAAVHPGTLSSIAGDLVLTTSRLVFTPLESKHESRTISWELARTKGRRKAGDVLASVRAGDRPGLMRPPTLRLTTGDGTVWEIGVLAGRRKANRSPENAVARDRMVEAVRGRLA